jgi:hypothetical protein
MTKTQIELLMTRDVDEISEVAVHQPSKHLRVTLKNAAALLARESHKHDFEERLHLFKLLRFLQAVLAGVAARITVDVARAVDASVQLLLQRNDAADLNRAARDVLSVLRVKTSAPATIKNKDLSIPGLVGVYQKVPGNPPRYAATKGLKSTLGRQTSSRSEMTRAKVVPKPKGLVR